MALELSDFGKSDSIIWEKVDASSISGYTWSGTNTLSDIKYNDNGSTTLYGASGVLNTGNGEYYKFNYTNPLSNQASTQNIINIKRDINNEYFYTQTGNNGYGGGIYNSLSSSNVIVADFINNSTLNYGGAVYNANKSKIQSIQGLFLNNISNSAAGAIFNYGEIDKLNGIFIWNEAKSHAGTLFNNSGANIEIFSGLFIGNTSEVNGGAIFNNASATINNIIGEFIGNSALNYGGAIYNNNANINIIDGRFINNHSNSLGGAILNWGNIQKVRGDFVGNSSDKSGGAIFNNSKSNIEFLEGTFLKNISKEQGGAIFNSSDATIKLTAKNKDTIFYGNKNSTGYNDISIWRYYQLKCR